MQNKILNNPFKLFYAKFSFKFIKYLRLLFFSHLIKLISGILLNLQTKLHILKLKIKN
jgi:hypothetical protein